MQGRQIHKHGYFWNIYYKIDTLNTLSVFLYISENIKIME